MSQSLRPIAVRDRRVEERAVAVPTVGPMRWLRGAVVGSVASALAWLGHSLASGMSPDPASLLWTMACAVPVAVALSGRRWGLLSLLTLLMGAQVAFHVAFTDMGHPMTSGHGSMSASMAHAGTAGHSLFSILAAGHPGTVMVLAHVTAALVTALLLRRGEDWCWALVQLLVGPVVMLRVDGAPLTPRRYAVAPRLSRSEQRLLLVDCASRRGPPLRLA